MFEWAIMLLVFVSTYSSRSSSDIDGVAPQNADIFFFFLLQLLILEGQAKRVFVNKQVNYRIMKEDINWVRREGGGGGAGGGCQRLLNGFLNSGGIFLFN